ncbi:MAG: radical SAM protein [Proteobacteria bacterium]|nr:radical SAM protein [Pseudomonadota bacterium]
MTAVPDGSPLDWPLEELAIELTTYCNLKCRMCSVWEGKANGVSAERTRELLREGRQLGAVSFVPCGAESFMRKDFVDLVEYADSIGYERTEIVTNGILLPRYIERLQQVPSVRLHVSIDGPEAVHDDLRGEGSYARALEGIRLAVEHGVSVGLSGVLMRPTVETNEHIVDLAVDLGLVEVSFQPFQPEINGSERDHSEWMFDPTARPRVEERIAELRAYAASRGIHIYTDAILDEVPPYLFEGLRPIPEGGCYMPSRFLLIDVRGQVYPCFFMREQAIGNVMAGDSLLDLWHGETQTALQMVALTSQCPGCLAACSDIATFEGAPEGIRR